MVSAFSNQLRFAIMFMLRLCHWTRWRSYSTIEQHHQRAREKRAKEQETKKLVSSVRFMRHARRINQKHTALLLNVYVLASRSREKGRNIWNENVSTATETQRNYDVLCDFWVICIAPVELFFFTFRSLFFFILFLFALTPSNFWFRCSLTLGTSNVEQNGSFDTNIIVFYASIGFTSVYGVC